MPVRLGGRRMRGVVDRVCRDIFEGAVEVTLNGIRHSFQEPEAIVLDGSSIMFLYGDVDPELEDDASVFIGAADGGYEGSLYDHLQRTASRPVTKTVFKMMEFKNEPKFRWRNRLAVS